LSTWPSSPTAQGSSIKRHLQGLALILAYRTGRRARSGRLSISVDRQCYNWKKAGESLEPYLYWTIGGTRCGSSSIPDIIRIRQGSWMGYLGSDQGLLDINFPHHFLPLSLCDGLCPITQDKIGRVLNVLRTNWRTKNTK
jgi:hypothetical protein